jgi:hypothetical protein
MKFFSIFLRSRYTVPLFFTYILSSNYRSHPDLSIDIEFSLNSFIYEDNTIILCIRELLHGGFSIVIRSRYTHPFSFSYILLLNDRSNQDLAPNV